MRNRNETTIRNFTKLTIANIISNFEKIKELPNPPFTPSELKTISEAVGGFSRLLKNWDGNTSILGFKSKRK